MLCLAASAPSCPSRASCHHSRPGRHQTGPFVSTRRHAHSPSRAERLRGVVARGRAHPCMPPSSGMSSGSPRLRKGTVCTATSEDIPQVVVEGDIVRINYVCKDETGEVLEDSTTEYPDGLSFEVGAGEVVGNPFFQGFDAAVRGLAVGQTVSIEASGGEWNQDLVFKVPIDHEEMVRLANRYKNQGGLKEGAVLELSNGGKALILKVADDSVLLDANNMLAGKTLVIDIEILGLESFAEAQQ